MWDYLKGAYLRGCSLDGSVFKDYHYLCFVIEIHIQFLAAKILEISDEQRQHILNSQDFSQFFDKATRLVEKAICENTDICFDYGETGEDGEG